MTVKYNGSLLDAQKSSYVQSQLRGEKQSAQEVVASNLVNSAYGDIVTTKNNPNIASHPVYEFIPANFRTYSAFTGVASVDNHVYVCSTGTTQYAYGAIQSFRSINYRAGAGGEIRFSGYFDTAVSGAETGIGGIAIGNEISFGTKNGSFGIYHRHGGYAEVRTLTVTGAAGGSENLTLTLNSVGYTIPLTAGTTAFNAKQIADWLNSNQSVWVADQNASTVVIAAASDGAKSGTYTFSSATATGSIAQTTAGVTKTTDFTAMEDFNGNIPTGFDYTKGNEYRIQYQNGYGDIKFYIGNELGNYQRVHTVLWGNSKNTINVTNPSLRVGLYAYSVGATTDVNVYCAYLAGYTQGGFEKIRNPRAYSYTKTSSTTLTNILTIRNRRIYNGYYNQVEFEPVFITMSNASNKNAVFQIRANPTVTGTQNFQNIGTNSITEVDVAGTTVAEDGRSLAQFTVAAGASLAVNLTDFAIRVPPTLQLVIAGKQVASGTSGELTVGITWYEDL